MINLVMRPSKEPVVSYEGVYYVDMDGKPLKLAIRAKNARAAEEKLRFVFNHELSGKRLDFKPEDFQDDEGRGEPHAAGGMGQDHGVDSGELPVPRDHGIPSPA